MATAQDIVTGAYRRLGLAALGESLDATMAAEGLTVLNNYIHSIKSNGGTITYSDLALSGTIPLADELHEHLKAVLAARIAPYFGKADAQLARDAAIGHAIIMSDYFTVSSAASDAALLNLPSQQR